MPWIKVPSEVHKAMKEYLVDIEDMTLGDLVENAVCFAMKNLQEFEEFAEIGEAEEEETEEEGETEEDAEEDEESGAEEETED
jgi:hypothetical protein